MIYLQRLKRLRFGFFVLTLILEKVTLVVLEDANLTNNVTKNRESTYASRKRSSDKSFEFAKT